MALLKVNNLRFNYSDNELFENVCLQLNEQEHAVLVGQNGSGKTTFLDLISLKLIPDKGTIEWSPHVSFSYLDQHFKVHDHFSVRSFLEMTYKNLFEKEKEMNHYFELGSDPNCKNYERYFNMGNAINDFLISEHFYEIETSINKIIVGLGISQDKLDEELINLSSGQREKIYLAKMLLEKNDVLLLDEPTNYLDVQHVKWLTEYLKNYPKAFLVVSHDEDFLKEIANVVFHLKNKKIERYKGTYDYFLEQSKIRAEQYQKDYEAQQKFIKKEEAFIAAHIVRATSSRAAKSRRTRLSHLVRLEEVKDDTNKVFIHFPYSGDIGKDILDVDKLLIGYKSPLLNPISFSLKKNEKIAIIGKNGVGKSTLIKTILKIIPSLGGNFKFNDKVIINYFSQVENDNLNITPIQFIEEYYPNMKVLDIRKVLARCGVKANLALKPLKELSGGEEAKTRLALLTLRKSNVLVLDEPTNHLDITAKEALKEAISEYEGVVILVSHEEDFYNDIVDYVIKLD